MVFSWLMSMASDACSLFPAEYQEKIGDGVNGGLLLANYTVLITFLLELVSLPTVRGVLSQRDGKSLYFSAVFLNLLNHYIYGIPVYTVAVLLFCRERSAHTVLELLLRTVGVMLVHSWSFYYVHKTFHTNPDMYKYHRYHHRFNTYVPPVSANAVSSVEYLLGYVIPFAFAAVLVYPDQLEMKIAITVISTCNVLIHTPRLEELSKKLPPFLVSSHDHIEHHKKLTVNYAAPWINLDWFVDKFGDLFSGEKEDAAAANDE